MFEIIPVKIDSPLLISGLSPVTSTTDNPKKLTAIKIKVKYKIETNIPRIDRFDKFLITNFISLGLRGGRKKCILIHI